MITDLFPGPGYYLVTLYLPQRDDDTPVVMRERAHMCSRCGSLAADKQRHYRWHQAVDTGATTLLPSDTKDPR